MNTRVSDVRVEFTVTDEIESGTHAVTIPVAESVKVEQQRYRGGLEEVTFKFLVDRHQSAPKGLDELLPEYKEPR